MPAFESILFDLDGTLTDPKIGIIGSIRYALEKMAAVIDPADDLTWCIGPPLLGSFERLLGDPALASTALQHYRDRFGVTGMFENTLFAGITATLADLVAAGTRLFVATSKPHFYARPIVDHFDLTRFFIAVEGAELDGTRADKGALIAHVISTHKIDAARALMVGDREHDIIGAKKNGLRSLGVLYGYGSEAELARAGADALCATPAELMASIRRLA